MTDQQTLRRRLVAELRRQGFLRSERVAEAFAAVRRHAFVPGHRMKDVYTDRVFITKVAEGVPVSSSSQPAIMAAMLEQLDVEPGQRVLEIGAGTGYNAALLSHLVGAGGQVTTVDIDREVAEQAREHLRSEGFDGVRVVKADGGYGEREDAPYDRIIATASCWRVPRPWVDQLVEGGLMVVPLRLNGPHVSLALRKEGETLVGCEARECGFMPLRGAFAPKETHLDLPGMRISADVPIHPDARRGLASLLSNERKAKVVYPRGRDGTNSPLYYLVLQGKPVLQVLRERDGRGPEPFVVLLVSPRSAVNLLWQRPKRNRFTVYGDTDQALDFLRDALQSWRREEQPDPRDLRVVVRPSKARLGALPRPANGRYRFRRGDHVFEMWFER